MKVWNYILFLVYVSVSCDSDFGNIDSPFLDAWTFIKRQHRGRQLLDESTQRLVSTDREYFKESLLRPMLIERVSGTPGNLQVQQHIKSLMSNLKWTITEDSFVDKTPYGKKQFNNIIADQDPTAPRKLTLACHFDSKYFEHFEFIGATDSAVPCAMLIDLATALNSSLWSSQKNPLLSLQFIFFDGEEAFKTWSATDSIYGARHLANQMHQDKREVLREVIVSQLDRMDVFVLLDLIGAPNPRFSSWFSNTKQHFQSLQNIESRLADLGEMSYGNTHSSPYFSTYRQTSGIEDDHIPFLRKNVPILHLIAYPFPHVWHKQTDNEDALDFNSIDDLNKIFRVFVAEYLHLRIQ